MKPSGSTYWVVIVSLFFAYLLAIVPLPDRALNWRPQWVLLFVFYLTMALPNRVGLGLGELVVRRRERGFQAVALFHSLRGRGQSGLGRHI